MKSYRPIVGEIARAIRPQTILDLPSGDGWLRILRFVPGEDKVYVQTYSPWLNQFEADADSEFTLDFPMSGAFAAVGSVQVPSGATASVTAGALPASRVW